MARLSDECIAAGEGGLGLEAALALIAREVPVVAEAQSVPLAAADGRIAAADVLSPMNLPPFDNSAVDGFAVRFGDLAPADGTILPLAGRVAAGELEGSGDEGARAVRIFTGAPMPASFDTVFMQEDVEVAGGSVRLPPGLPRGANRRRAGEDVAEGGLVVEAGRRLSPPDLALAAAAGLSRLEVRRPVRVALFSTGDELAEVGAELGPAAIHDSNRVLLAALLRRFGSAVSDLGILRDDPGSLAERLGAAAVGHDLVLTSGGVSAGEEDHVRSAIGKTGRLAFWRLAVKPGGPVAVGRVGEAAFVGLPGNPVAAYVALVLLVRPILAQLGGERFVPPPRLPLRAAFRHRKRAGRREYVRASLRRGPDGVAELVKFPHEGAALISSLTGSDGLIELSEADTEIDEGHRVAFIPHALLS